MVTTFLHRPYVFAFLIAFLVLGRLYFGWRKTFLWLVIGYVVAWASEFSSIHNGFPYGLYHYVYENMPGELMVLGVPFWDSLSYPFMIFAGYTTAEFILKGAPKNVIPAEAGIQNTSRAPATVFRRNDVYAALLGAFLTMLLDIIIDPLTVRGDRWFLGNIYYYPNGGEYFGVPLTNFFGWFLVPLAVIVLFLFLSSPRRRGSPDSQWDSRFRGNDKTLGNDKPRLRYFLPPLFYLSIALFNIAITVWINEPLIVAIDCFLLIPIVGLVIYRVKSISQISSGAL
jgi:putative membrane protein